MGENLVLDYIEGRKIKRNPLTSEERNLIESNTKLVEENKWLRLDKKNLTNIINDIEKYIGYWSKQNIDEKTMLILNDILLIKNGMSDRVERLKLYKE